MYTHIKSIHILHEHDGFLCALRVKSDVVSISHKNKCFLNRMEIYHVTV